MSSTRRSDLIAERKPLCADIVDGELMTVDGPVDLRDECVQRARHGRDQQERADQDASVEMPAQQERTPPLCRRRGRPRASRITIWFDGF
ncbi:Uncharacterised protein [Mycobacteroides abscessus subsp. abscessus]|nr:Uncharacterised protein [Mycobacteroides abscessus subsp. abscessus]